MRRLPPSLLIFTVVLHCRHIPMRRKTPSPLVARSGNRAILLLLLWPVLPYQKNSTGGVRSLIIGGRLLRMQPGVAGRHALGWRRGPGAHALLRLGFVEGSRTPPPARGAANRRFYFENFIWNCLGADRPRLQNETTRRRDSGDRCQGTARSVLRHHFSDRRSCRPIDAFATLCLHSDLLAEGLAIQSPRELVFTNGALLFAFETGHDEHGAVEHACRFARSGACRVGVREIGRTCRRLFTLRERHGLVRLFCIAATGA